LGDLHSPFLREKSRRRLLLPGRSRQILLNTGDVGIVVGNAHRRQITIPRMRKWLAKAAVQFRIFRL
jgi:hypothetical protein